MSAKSKAASRDKRKQKKRARKETMKAQYRAWAEAGSNKKKKQKQTGGRRLVKDVKHPNGACGNIGCSLCSSIAAAYKANKAKLKRPKKVKGFDTVHVQKAA